MAFIKGFVADVLEDIGGGRPEEPTIDPRAANLTQAQVKEFERFQQLAAQLTPQQLRLLGIGSATLPREAQLEEEARIATQESLGAALRGEVSSPGLERDIERERGLLQESIARRGQQRGTAEAQRQGRFLEASLVAREQARNQQIQQLGGLGSQQAGILGQRVQQLGIIPTQQIGLLQASGIPLQTLEAQRAVRSQFELAALQQRMQTEKNLFDLGGSFAGGSFGGGGGGGGQVAQINQGTGQTSFGQQQPAAGTSGFLGTQQFRL